MRAQPTSTESTTPGTTTAAPLFTVDRTKVAQNYLEATTSQLYFDGINPDDHSAYTEMVDKVAPLVDHVPDENSLQRNRIVSVGVGSGQEVQAIAQLFPGSEVIGIDISPSAVALARAHLTRESVNAEVMCGDATNMPFPDGSLQGLVLSAILHEVYSYMPKGREAWVDAVKQIALKSSTDGATLLRDFAAPSQGGRVQLSLRTPIARQFYEYFSTYYRTFQGEAMQGAGETFVDRRAPNQDDYPLPADDSNAIELELHAAAEMLLHFKNFMSDTARGVTVLGNPDWKEIGETYLLPHPSREGSPAMTPKEYAATVTEIGTQALRGLGDELVCVQATISGRPEAAEKLLKHFDIQLVDAPSIPARTILQGCTSKMEMILRRVRAAREERG